MDTHPWPPGLQAGRGHSRAHTLQSSAHTPWWSGLWEDSTWWDWLLCPARSSPPESKWQRAVNCRKWHPTVKLHLQTKTVPSMYITDTVTRAGHCDLRVLISVLPEIWALVSGFCSQKLLVVSQGIREIGDSIVSSFDVLPCTLL